MKALFDFIAAAVGLVLLMPVLLAIAVIMKATSRGPIFYSGTRVGLHGKTFKMHKFRTMVVGADKLGGSCTYEGDSRVTRTGAWLRKSKLDELPQLLNVLLGDMSLVGPRPEVQEYVQMFSDEERAILSVRPGITDWATIWDRNEERTLAGTSDPDRDYREAIRPEKIRLQLEYVRRRSFLIDVAILFETVKLLMLHPSISTAVPTIDARKP